MFNKILVINRGEIAVRIIRACRELGIITAAVYSEADKNNLHTVLADESYFIGKAEPSFSYLNQEKIISLAKEISADAVHPGYGFLSENASFIKALEDSDITFIGPSSKSVMLMGNKIAARNLMKQNKVPVVPGTVRPVTSAGEAMRAAEAFGYPVLLKPSAGGGGKGMRKITTREEFSESFEAAKREAMKAFGDDTIYVEKFIRNPRHIEVQVIADKQGNYCHMFERECSIQRRHQKIIEEAPSVFVDEETRKKITEAALKAARACEYINAGTIEFLMDENKNFYFIEMNTRLQVEHPVTEMITSVDIVREQISVAAGNPLSFRQDDIFINGCAIECRVCAEDPANNFLPSAGKLTACVLPSGPGLRVDEGYIAGSDISVYYDSLIAKIITHGKDRTVALQKMKRALDEFHLAGVAANINFLKSLITSNRFVNGDFNIDFIEQEFSSITENDTEDDTEAASIIAAHLRNIQQDSLQIKSTYNRWIDQLHE